MPPVCGRPLVLKKLVEFLDREVEIWTTENTEPWMGILKEVNADFVTLRIDELETHLITNKLVAFRLSEGEQESGGNEHDAGGHEHHSGEPEPQSGGPQHEA